MEYMAGLPEGCFHLIEDYEEVNYILRHLSRDGCV